MNLKTNKEKVTRIIWVTFLFISLNLNLCYAQNNCFNVEVGDSIHDELLTHACETDSFYYIVGSRVNVSSNVSSSVLIKINKADNSFTHNNYNTPFLLKILNFNNKLTGISFGVDSIHFYEIKNDSFFILSSSSYNKTGNFSITNLRVFNLKDSMLYLSFNYLLSGSINFNPIILSFDSLLNLIDINDSILQPNQNSGYISNLQFSDELSKLFVFTNTFDSKSFGYRIRVLNQDLSIDSTINKYFAYFHFLNTLYKDSLVYTFGRSTLYGAFNFNATLLVLNSNFDTVQKYSYYLDTLRPGFFAGGRFLSANNNNLFIGTYTKSDNGPIYGNYETQILISKYNTFIQDTVWTISLKDGYHTALHDVFATEDGGCLLTTRTYNFNDATYPPNAKIIKIDSAGNTTWAKKIQLPHNIYIQVYPNPSERFININLKNHYSNITSIKIIDIQGKTVKSIIINEKSKRINIEALNSGIYFILGKTDTGKSFVKKFIKK